MREPCILVWLAFMLLSCAHQEPLAAGSHATLLACQAAEVAALAAAQRRADWEAARDTLRPACDAALDAYALAADAAEACEVDGTPACFDHAADLAARAAVIAARLRPVLERFAP